MLSQTEQRSVSPTSFKRTIDALKNRINELTIDRDYWKRQAKQFAIQLDRIDALTARDKAELEEKRT